MSIDNMSRVLVLLAFLAFTIVTLMALRFRWGHRLTWELLKGYLPIAVVGLLFRAWLLFAGDWIVENDGLLLRFTIVFNNLLTVLLVVALILSVVSMRRYSQMVQRARLREWMERT